MRNYLTLTLFLATLTCGCSSSSSPGGPGTSAEGGAGDAAAPGTDGGMVATNGTVHVTYNLDGAGDKSFDCVVDPMRVFLHHTVAGGGEITLGCDDGSPGLQFTTIGVGVPDMTGTFNEGQKSAVTFSQGTLQLSSGASATGASSPPQHTVTLTSWDLATEHAVGEANLPSFMDKGNSTKMHTLTMKVTFDITCTEAK